MLSVINIILGLALLVAGRKLFWLFVIAGGFIAGVQFATSVIQAPEWLTIVIGLVVGIAFAILARFFKMFAIGIAGYVLGSAIFSAFASTLRIDVNWIIWIIGGVIGIILIAVLFDWALINLSAFAGATLLVQALNTSDTIRNVAFLGLLVAGIVIQASSMRAEKKAFSETAQQ